MHPKDIDVPDEFSKCVTSHDHDNEYEICMFKIRDKSITIASIQEFAQKLDDETSDEWNVPAAKGDMVADTDLRRSYEFNDDIGEDTVSVYAYRSV